MIPALAALAPSIFQGAVGLGQIIGGSLMNPRRPTYNIPDNIKNNLAMTQNRLNGRMAGAAQLENNIARSQATANRQARMFGNSSQALASVGQTQQASNQAFQSLSVSEAQDRERREAALFQANTQMANYRDKAFEYNQNQPFQNKAATQAALFGGGLSNIMGATNNASTTMGQQKGLAALYPEIFGKGQGGRAKANNFPQGSFSWSGQEDPNRFYNVG